MYLPKELIDIIMEYIGLVKKRNGILMNQLDLNNKKYLYLKEHINYKLDIMQIVHKENFLPDRKSKIAAKIGFIYNDDKLKKSIVFKTIHVLIPPYIKTYYYLWEELGQD